MLCYLFDFLAGGEGRPGIAGGYVLFREPKVGQNEHLKKRKTDAHTEHVRKELKRMVRVRISS
jgi:hypothetical protein